LYRFADIAPGQNFIDALRREVFSVTRKYLVAIGTGHNNVLDPMSHQVIPHFVEHGGEVVLPAQVMGGFCAAIEDYADGRDLFFQEPV
jgi:hypothetical protein